MDESLLPPDESQSKTFLAMCERCGSTKELRLSDFSLDTEDPFQYECACGSRCRVLLSQRGAPRKKVNLICSFKLTADPGKAARFATVLDISVNGMRVGTDPIKSIAAGESLIATILLGTKQKTKLELPCVIRRIIEERPSLVLGVEFQALTDDQTRVLAPYLTAT
jgi:hypothetical protein